MPETPEASEAAPEKPDVPSVSEVPVDSDGAEKPAGLARKIDWGIPASVAAHAIVLALLIFGLPQWTHQTEEPEAIDVELVPPPPPPKSEPRQPEPELQEPEKPEQEAEAPEETKPVKNAEAEQVPPPPLRTLRPVLEFGEEDAGPAQSDEGETAREANADPATPTEEPAPKPEEESEPATEPEEEPETPLPDDPLPAAPETLASASPIPSPEAVPVPEPSPKPPRSVAAEAPASASEAQKTLSQHDTNAPVATTARGDLPRAIRAGELCANVLRLKLQNALPPYYPDLLPTYRLDQGTLLQVNKGAFRSFGEWYNLSFRCEVDQDATRVVSFSYNVGEAVPRSQWQQRGFPSR